MALLLTLLVIVFLSGCLSVQESENPIQEPDIVMLDLYANSDFLGNLESSDTACGAAVLGSKIKQLRSQNPEGSAFLCLGDALSGTPIAALVQGKSVIDVLNAVSYDTFTLGNHEFDWGPDTLVESLKNSNFPVLSANITYKETGKLLDGVQPYVILEKNGVKIGILGLTTISTPTIIREEYAEVLSFEDTTECAARYVPEIRAAGADIVIVAGHLPMYEGKDGQAFSGELYDIAMNVEGINALFGGHNDTLTVATVINGVPIVKSAFYGNELSHIRIQYDLNSKTVVSSFADIVNLVNDAATIEPDIKIASIVAEYAVEADRIFNKQIGFASKDIEIDYFYECAITNWFASAVKDATGADMAFINPSGVFESVSAGPITLRKIYQMSPFENQLVTTEMSGAQLKNLWETTLEQERMPKYGTLAFAGLFITYDSEKPDGQKVISLALPNGKEIRDADIFTVATLDFLSTGGNDYTLLAKLNWAGTGIMMRDAYARTLSKIGTLEPDTIGWMKDTRKL